MQDLEISSETLNILNFWKIIVEKKRRIALITGTAFFLSIVGSLLLPVKFIATAVVLPPNDSSTPFSQIRGSINQFAGNFLQDTSVSNQWIGILKSRNLQEAVINRFNLKEHYGVQTIDDSLRAFNGNYVVKETEEDLISISVEDEDPEMAAEIANAAVEELDRINREVGMSSGQRTRVFIDKRLSESKDELDSIEQELKRFQETTTVIKLDDQSKAIIEAVSSVKGQILIKEVELKTLLSFSTPENPQVHTLKSQIDELRKQLASFFDSKKANGDIFIPTGRLPALGYQYAKLLRDAKAQAAVYEFLTQQHEMAKIEEAKDTPTVQIIDHARPPQRKAKPKRAVIVVLMTVLAFLLSIFSIFLMEYIKKIKNAAVASS